MFEIFRIVYPHTPYEICNGLVGAWVVRAFGWTLTWFVECLGCWVVGLVGAWVLGSCVVGAFGWTLTWVGGCLGCWVDWVGSQIPPKCFPDASQMFPKI